MDQPSLSERSVFVTGATGFVGSHFVERLLSLGCRDVRCLVRSEPRFLGDLPVRRVQADLFDRQALSEALREVDFVVHIGAVTRARDWSVFRRQNVDATRSLLEALEMVRPSVEKVLLTSTLAAVGRGAESVADETSPLLPVSMYGRSKMEMEAVAAEYSERLPIVTVRPSAVYGPRESDIYTFFKTLRAGVCPIVGTGRDPAVSLVYVDDLIDGMIGALLSGTSAGKTYFLGSPENYNWREIRDASATALGRRVITIPIPEFLVGPVGAATEVFGRITGTYPPLNREKAQEIRYACTMCDSTKAMEDFGYNPSTGLWTGIPRTVSWYQAAGWL